jgi:hypothetical protein
LTRRNGSQAHRALAPSGPREDARSTSPAKGGAEKWQARTPSLRPPMQRETLTRVSDDPWPNSAFQRIDNYSHLQRGRITRMTV